MLKIGDFSKLSRVSIRMLRHYDEIGLLKPVWIDPESGYRYYSAEQLPVAGRINALKDMGFGLAAIGEILPCYESGCFGAASALQAGRASGLVRSDGIPAAASGNSPIAAEKGRQNHEL